MKKTIGNIDEAKIVLGGGKIKIYIKKSIGFMPSHKSSDINRTIKMDCDNLFNINIQELYNISPVKFEFKEIFGYLIEVIFDSIEDCDSFISNAKDNISKNVDFLEIDDHGEILTQFVIVER